MTTAWRDGALALVALVAVLVASRLGGIALAPVWLLCGAVAALVLEAVLLRYRTTVRAVWERRWVQFGLLVGVLGVVAVATVRSGSGVLSLLAGGLLAYCWLLALVSARRAATDRA